MKKFFFVECPLGVYDYCRNVNSIVCKDVLFTKYFRILMSQHSQAGTGEGKAGSKVQEFT